MNKSLGLLGIATLSVLVLSACAQTTPMGSMPSMDLSLSPSLNVGVVDGSVSQVVVPMGRLNDPLNTFFQSFTSVNGGAWKLSTPKGSGTNGGIVVASPARGALAIRQFDQSHVSAVSAVIGGEQVTLGGRIIAALAPSPSALATQGSSVFFVTANGSLEELSPTAQLAKVITTQRQIAASAAGRRCGVQAITAVAVNSAGQIALGARCGNGGTNTVFVKDGSSWWLGKTGMTSPNAVMRLDASGNNFIALVRTAGSSPSLRSLVVRYPGAMSSPSSSWSPRIDLMYGVLRSSVPNGHGGYCVLVKHSTKVSATDLTPGLAVRSLGEPLPSSAQGIVATTRGGSRVVEVLTVTGGRASFLVQGTQSTWRTVQSIKVAIPYGAA